METTRTEHPDGRVTVNNKLCDEGFTLYPGGEADIFCGGEVDLSTGMLDALVEERLKQRGMMAVPLTTWEDESPKQIAVTVRQLMSND